MTQTAQSLPPTPARLTSRWEIPECVNAAALTRVSSFSYSEIICSEEYNAKQTTSSSLSYARLISSSPYNRMDNWNVCSKNSSLCELAFRPKLKIKRERSSRSLVSNRGKARSSPLQASGPSRVSALKRSNERGWMRTKFLVYSTRFQVL